jgi:hypothetical protein
MDSSDSTLHDFPPLCGLTMDTDTLFHSSVKSKIARFYYNACSKSGSDNELQLLSRELTEILNLLTFDTNVAYSEGISVYARPYLELMYKMIAQTRDISYGKGERDLTYMMIFTWYPFFPELALDALLSCTTQYGCWKDIKHFCQYVRSHSEKGDNDPLIDVSTELIIQQLYKDKLWIEKGEGRETDSGEFIPLSNAAKWIPREKNKHGWLFDRMAIQWANVVSPCIMKTPTNSNQHERALNKCRSQFRRMISGFNRILDTVEVKQCAQQWSEIDPARVNKFTIMKQKNALLRFGKFPETVVAASLASQGDLLNSVALGRFAARAKEFDNVPVDRIQCSRNFKKHFDKNIMLDKIDKPEPFTNVTESTNYRTDIPLSYFVSEAFRLLYLVESLPSTQYKINLLNNQWKQACKGCHILDHFIPIVDISQDMCENDRAPLYNAIGLGCLIVEKSTMGRRLLLVDHTPIWINLENALDFVSMIKVIFTHTLGGTSSNIEGAIDLLIHSIQCTNMPTEQIEKMVFVVLSNRISNRLHDAVTRAFSFGRFGPSAKLLRLPSTEFNDFLRLSSPEISIPHMIYWNLSHQTKNEFPCDFDTPRTSMVSGVSHLLLNHFRFMGLPNVRNYCPYETVCNFLMNSRYDYMDYLFRQNL